MKDEIHSVLPRIDNSSVAAHLQREQSKRPDNESEPPTGAEHDRHAEIGIRRFPAEEIVIDGGDRGGREAKHETIEGEVMKHAARLGMALVGIGASGAVAG